MPDEAMTLDLATLRATAEAAQHITTLHKVGSPMGAFFMATASPPVVLALLARLERAEAALRRIRLHLDNSGRGNPIVDDRIIDRIEEEVVDFFTEDRTHG